MELSTNLAPKMLRKSNGLKRYTQVHLILRAFGKAFDRRYQYWFIIKFYCSWYVQVNARHVQLSCHVTKPTRKGKKLIDQISSNINKKKMLHSDILPCPTISDHDAASIVINLPQNRIWNTLQITAVFFFHLLKLKIS